MQELVLWEQDVTCCKCGFKKHFRRRPEVHRIALYNSRLYVIRHLVDVCVFSGELVKLELHITRRVAHEPDLSSLLIDGESVDHLEGDLLATFGTHAYTLAVDPVEIDLGNNLAHGYIELVALRAAECSVDNRHRVYEHIAHCRQLLADSDEELQNVVILFKEILCSLHLFRIHLIRRLHAGDRDVRGEIPDYFAYGFAYDREAVMHVLSPVEALLDGLWEEPVGTSAERVSQ